MESQQDGKNNELNLNNLKEVWLFDEDEELINEGIKDFKTFKFDPSIINCNWNDFLHSIFFRSHVLSSRINRILHRSNQSHHHRCLRQAIET